ncbi:hypothetical protein PtrEW4_004061 [Pyrenophora tritici-repentis]|nr:hypothetical protein PtrEW4_004061 [Pyrenophora tritici-repentis]KAI1593812.1 hypothetical protein PtrEW13061_002796 [Pyrenophora tritici-repentis]PWO26013.1 BetA, Choline dehydrogenase [Pyrenophora tritici-repentis]PZC96117.1 hypothetical protein A1F95_05554 [Pyrenophora tritici-repentis]
MLPTSRQNYHPHRHHRHQNYTYDYNYLHETTLSPHPHPFSQSSHTLEDIPIPTFTPADLPSRLLALNRRAAIVSAALAHLSAVVKPLETTKSEDLTENQLQDIWEEGVGLGRAMEEFREQMEEG